MRQLDKAVKTSTKAVSLFSNVQAQLVKAQQLLDAAEAEHSQEIQRLQDELTIKLAEHKRAVAVHDQHLVTVAANREANARVLEKLADFIPAS